MQQCHKEQVKDGHGDQGQDDREQPAFLAGEPQVGTLTSRTPRVGDVPRCDCESYSISFGPRGSASSPVAILR